MIGFVREIVRDLARYLAERKAAMLERISSPEIRLSFLKVPIDNLYWKSASGRPDADANEIWPFCLLEFPISIFRLASAFFREQAPKRLGAVLGDMALFGLKGWTLRPYSPQSFGYKLHNPKPFPEENLLLPKPLTFQRDEILDEPDRCGIRLVAQVYESFGYWEKEIPQEFDRERGRLVFPNE